MQRGRLAAAAGAVVALASLSAPAFVTLAAPAGAAVTNATDKAGDTVTDVIEDPITTPAADIVAASVDAQPEAIVFTVKTAALADPLKDRNWSSDFTGVVWKLDTNGDRKRDYQIEYTVDQETKQLAADLLRSGGGGQPPADCQPQAGFDPVAGYTVTVAPRCLSGATSFSYQLFSAYTVDATDPGADVGTDVTPDDGWAGPVSVTLAAGVTPATLSQPVSTPIDAQQAKPDGAGQGPTSSTTVRSNAPSTVTTRPSAARPRAGSGSASSPAQPATGLPIPGLAHTGPGHDAARAAGLAVGVMLIGIGLLIASRRTTAA